LQDYEVVGKRKSKYNAKGKTELGPVFPTGKMEALIKLTNTVPVPDPNIILSGSRSLKLPYFKCMVEENVQNKTIHVSLTFWFMKKLLFPFFYQKRLLKSSLSNKNL
jgi:hypothetical protein